MGCVQRAEKAATESDLLLYRIKISNLLTSFCISSLKINTPLHIILASVESEILKSSFAGMNAFSFIKTGLGFDMLMKHTLIENPLTIFVAF
jgi:hypothetical protein